MADHYQRIFLLSHMRAFTSLAGHILGSNPAINGYYEMHVSYCDASALHRQLAVYGENDALKPGSRHVFDKLLHNDYVLNLDEPALAGSQVLVSIMAPGQTIRSIVDLFSRKETVHPLASPEAATDYYIERVRTLVDFCRRYPQRYYYYDAEMFQAEPGILLAALSQWLQLDEPLTEHYQLFSQTGKARKGDSSKFIHSGRIDRKPIDYSHVRIPAALLEKATEVYQTGRRVMREQARESVTLPGV